MGDSAILIELGSEIDPEINSQIYFLVAAIKRSQLAAIVELIPAYRSLLVNYDPLVSRYGEMVALLDELVAGNAASEVDTGTATIIELPVVYGGEDGPDLDTVADNAGLSIRDVIEIHSGVDYRVYMIGFAPGFPYL
ncbi:MAG TPA: carboxyltransferase domain-containing protein, partial [Dehalococcoidia bacterium]|nr:carboxyltransferase domain-containing protein [Dehalococcoidia bacterium]